MKAAFFLQCAATSEHLALISKLQPLLEKIHAAHKRQLEIGNSPIPAHLHREIVSELTPYLVEAPKVP